MFVIQEQKCQELSQTIKYMSERQEKLLAMMERKKSLLREAQGEFSQERKWNCRKRSRAWKKAMDTDAKSEAEEKVLPMEEAVDCSEENNGTKGVTVVKDVHSTEMEGRYVMFEHTGEVGEEQQPVRVKAPPQKRRAVIRVESAETQDYVSG